MNAIAIDTNVFLQLLNDRNNPDSHIDQLLSHLARKKFSLLLDSTQKIQNEYEEKIVPIIRKVDETGIQLLLLKYWMELRPFTMIDLDPTDRLMTSIKKVIHEKDEHADRAFVYVVCIGNCCLVSNDDQHIISRRSELRSETRKLRGNDTVFKNTREAIQHLVAKPA